MTRSLGLVPEDDFFRLASAMAEPLHANGQATDDTIEVIEACRRMCGVRSAQLIVDWERVEVSVQAQGGRPATWVCRVRPLEVNVCRVAAVMVLADRLLSGDLDRGTFLSDVAEASVIPAPSAPLFTAASAIGAAAMAVIFGETRPAPLAVIAMAAGAGAIVRRCLGWFGAGLFAQNFAASLLAGLAAALCLHAGVATDFEIMSACPCMILIPGPHLLNGMHDLLSSRVPLGTARLLYALVSLTSISAGLLTGLVLGGYMLPTHGLHGDVPLWLVTTAGGIAAMCFALFYATPFRMLAWPTALGVVARGIDWWVQKHGGLPPAEAVFCASAVVGTLLVFGRRPFRLPFAGIAFASVVSMMPGIFIFPMTSALVELTERSSNPPGALVAEIVGNASTAILIVLAMAVGLLLPKSLADVARQWRRDKPP